MDVAHYYLDGNADVVEFCPHSSFHHVLAAATYTLQEGDRPTRSGSVSIFNFDHDLGKLELFHRLETAGIFDMKWNPDGDKSTPSPLLAQADADGYLRIHQLGSWEDDSDTHGNLLQELSSKKITASMCLCLDWNPSSTSISLGLSDGSIAITSLLDCQMKITQNWEGHKFEVWATSFDLHSPHLLYTGSDDCKFACWDLRNDTSATAFQNSKSHEMGVCCISKSPNDPHSLLTGSYDKNLRIWDIRMMAKPVIKTSICLGGGVWRIKHHPFVPNLVLVACMHNGFAIVKIRNDEVRVIEMYTRQESLAYGADWYKGNSRLEDKRKNSVVATCSFYDRLLKIWMPESISNA